MSDLIVYVIYANPTDYPGKFVLRRWQGLNPDPDPMAVSNLYDEVKKELPAGVKSIPKFPYEDPCILETWI